MLFIANRLGERIDNLRVHVEDLSAEINGLKREVASWRPSMMK